jgi:hypothetical protein
MFRTVLLLSFITFCFFIETNAQESSVEITLLDQNNASISSFSAQLKNEKKQLVKKFVSKNKQIIMLTGISEGVYFIEINAIGFNSLIEKITINKGNNLLNFVLDIAEIKAEVKVDQTEQEKRFDDAVSKNYTEKEINDLPGTPDEIKKEFERKYGDDVVIRVNGFKSSSIPPKEQIAAVRVVRSSFDAEFHDIGLTIVDITTKAGGDTFLGFVKFDGNHYKLNARNPLSLQRIPQQSVNITSFLIFPAFKKRTSLSTLLVANQNSKSVNFIGVNPIKGIENEIKSNRTFFLPSIVVAHNLTKNHVLNIIYGLVKLKTTNLGVGGFDLSERSYTKNTTGNLLQISETGVIKKKFSNQFKLEVGSTISKSIPNSKNQSIIVLGSFSEGGANINNKSNGFATNATDIVFFDYKKHSLKFGGEIQYETQKSENSDNINGSFTFLNFINFQNNRPYSFIQRRASTATNLSQIQLAGFVQDDIRLYKNFQIGLGLRYEKQNNLKDSNNFSPRFSFVWSPDKEAKIVIRSGVGIFYKWLDTSPLSTILSNDGRNGGDLIIINPSFPNPGTGGVNGNSFPPSIMKKDDNLINPYTFINKTVVNYRINNRFNLESTYTFKRSIHQFRSRDINSPINGLRPNSLFGRITQIESSGNSRENALELKLDGGLKKGFSFDAIYKLGKIISDYEDIFSLPSDSYNTSLEKAVSNLDQRHKFSTRLSFPSWKSLSFNTTFRLESPRPYSITTGRDDNGDSVINDRPPGIGRNSERGSWFKQVDANFSWRTKLGKEDVKNPLSKIKNQMVFTATIQNLFNQTNKQNFVGIQTSSFFRQATSATTPRTIQFGLSYIF